MTERDSAARDWEGQTALSATGRPPLPEGLRLVVASGPDAGAEIPLRVGTYFIGKAPSCELALSDATVSRRHLEVTVRADGVRVRDLGSTNGSFFLGARFDTIEVGEGATFTIGDTELRIAGSDGAHVVPLSEADHFGDLFGVSVAMRQVFALLERLAAADSPALVQGETGTGKELVAEALHARSGRAGRPFVICDLGALPRSLIESELFGHVRGAFTGADRDREGAFAQAEGGTIFLDEVGELDLELQPRLLRALERRQVKPVGGSTFITVNARVVAATNRDLVADVRTGRFREDLYHRLAVVRVDLPPLRDRRDDIPPLVERFLRAAADAVGREPPAVPPPVMAALVAHDWPGNVRELRNVLERALALAPEAPMLDLGLLGLGDPTPRLQASAAPLVDVNVPFKAAKNQLVDVWERDYVAAVLDKTGNNVSQAARRAGIDRVYLHRLMKKHGLGN